MSESTEDKANRMLREAETFVILCFKDGRINAIQKDGSNTKFIAEMCSYAAEWFHNSVEEDDVETTDEIPVDRILH